MIRWHYRGPAVFGAGLALALLSLATVFLTGLAQAPSPAAGPVPLFAGELVIRHPDSPSLGALLAGRAAARPRALAAEPCARILRASPAVASVIPFSAARLSLKGDLPGAPPRGDVLLVGVFPGAESFFGERLGLEADEGFDDVLMVPEGLLAAGGAARGRASPRFYLDVPGAADRFNFIPAKSVRAYADTAFREPDARLPLCFVNASFFRRCTRVSLLPFSEPGPNVPDRPVREKGDFIVPLKNDAAPDYPFLFSLRLPDEKDEAVTPAPGYFLVALRAGRNGEAAALAREWAGLFAAYGIAAAIDPPDVPAAGAGLSWRIILILGGGFLLVLLLANLVFRPRLLPGDPAVADRPGRVRFRPSFVSRSFFIALTFTTIGVLWGLALIPLYNLLAPPDMRQLLSVERIEPPLTALAWAAAYIVLFTVLSLPGPLARAARLAQRSGRLQRSLEDEE